MNIPFPSYGQQMQAIRADEALRRDYFNPKTIEIGDRVNYRDENDDTDDRAWNDAERILRSRSMCLHDDGGGYVAAWRYAADGSYLDQPVVGDQPATVR